MSVSLNYNELNRGYILDGKVENSPIGREKPSTGSFTDLEATGAKFTIPLRRSILGVETPNFRFSLPEHTGLPDRDYWYDPSIIWDGGESKFGKWRIHHNTYESDWMLTYNCRYDQRDGSWGPRDSGDSRAHICALARFDVAEGVSGRNVFEIKFEKGIEIGTITSATSGTVADSDRAWTTNEAQNHYLFILDSDKAIIESHLIASNTSDTIVISGSFKKIPKVGGYYSIGPHPSWITGSHYIFYDGSPTYQRGAPAELKIASAGGLDSCLKLSASETVGNVKLNLKNYYSDGKFRIEKVNSETLSPSFSEDTDVYLTMPTIGAYEGFFGFGIDAPLYRVHVSGDIKLTGSLRFNDGTSLSTSPAIPSSVSGTGDVSITADSDESSTGSILFKIGSATEWRIANNGRFGNAVSPNGTFTIQSQKSEPTILIELSSISSLPDESYTYDAAMKWSGGETKFGKWRQYFNCMEHGYTLIYNSAVDPYTAYPPTYAGRDSGNAEANICAMFRINVAEGNSGQNFFGFEFASPDDEGVEPDWWNSSRMYYYDAGMLKLTRKAGLESAIEILSSWTSGRTSYVLRTTADGYFKIEDSSASTNVVSTDADGLDRFIIDPTTGLVTVVNSLYVGSDCSALTFTDRTPFPKDLKEAYSSIHSMKKDGKGELDHSKLHNFIKSDKGRNLSAVVSSQNEVLKDLIKRIQLLEKGV
uniref:Uncharacterized protein n=1 Tax=viral metagenome TaxID=1070528 RepID=A0A6M3J6M5_9ZZZZ